MRCANCGTKSTTGRKFCAACGSPLTNRCQKCGAENAPSSSFCEDCGSARVRSEVGWVRLWLDEKYQAPVMLIYCPPCARLFDA